jgi:hypothetical protein
MNPKNTRIWLAVAAVLFAFIFFFHRHAHKGPAGPVKPLPDLRAASVTALLVRLQGQPQIHAVFTNQAWQITEPTADLGNARSIQSLIEALEKLTAATQIPASELIGHTNEEYGFEPEQISLSLQQGGQKLPQIRFGRKTNPGDQIFVQVAGDGSIYVIDAAVLNLIPRTVNAWREPTVINLNTLPFDHVGVTNTSASFLLERETNRVWRMVSPVPSRADNARIHEGLTKLHSLRIGEFVPDSPKPDLDAIGLAAPELAVGFYRGTNSAALLLFGKTNSTGQVFARRADRNAIFTVPSEALALWRHAAVNDFRDRHLLTLPTGISAIEVKGEDLFRLERQTNVAWRIMPQNLPADARLAADLLSNLTNMLIADFKDVVSDPFLPEYGLATPLRQFRIFGPSYWVGATNPLLANLCFGTNKGKVYARRPDEGPFPPPAVYTINADDFARLPSVSWQMRDRRLWAIATNAITGVTIRHAGKTRQLIRRGAYKWSLGPNSVGDINELALEETVRDLAEVEAVVWAGRGKQNRARFGFADDGHQITLDLTGGDKATVEFGGQAPSGLPYAGVTLDGDFWVLEFPPSLYRHVLAYLTIPQGIK